MQLVFNYSQYGRISDKRLKDRQGRGAQLSAYLKMLLHRVSLTRNEFYYLFASPLHALGKWWTRRRDGAAVINDGKYRLHLF